MDSVNQTATRGINLAGWVVNGWNTISLVIGNYVNQTG
jgi:hypothetical protein